jgi:flagellar P-ring protein precursor FlgI
LFSVRKIVDQFAPRLRRVSQNSLALALAVSLSAPLAFSPVQAASRIKDIVDIEGVRENQLIGYGLVVGLKGTGDSLGNSPFTLQSLQAMLERLGVNTRGENLRTVNVAAVVVTANLPPFSTQGTRIDVSVNALGDAKSLEGGTLLVTPLLGADGEAYAIAQGAIAIGGFTAEGEAASITKGVPTSGRISSGALVEREIAFTLENKRSLRLTLRNPDLTTSRRIALAINELIGQPIAEPNNASVVSLKMPDSMSGNIVSLLTDIEQLVVEPDQPAKVVIDENSGIIVMGRDVRVSEVAIAQGNLTVVVSEDRNVVQPNPLANGQTAVEPNTAIGADENSNARLALLGDAVTLQELVNGLNELGIGPRDLITILQAIKAAGALQAEVEVM